MLYHIKEQHSVELTEIDREWVDIDVGLYETSEASGILVALVDTNHEAPAVSQALVEVSGTAADVDHPLSRTDLVEHNGRRALEVKFRLIDGLVLRLREIELRVVKNPEALQKGLGGSKRYVTGVFEAIDITDLVPVVRGDFDFDNPPAAQKKLDQDLRVEMKIVRIEPER